MREQRAIDSAGIAPPATLQTFTTAQLESGQTSCFPIRTGRQLFRYKGTGGWKGKGYKGGKGGRGGYGSPAASRPWRPGKGYGTQLDNVTHTTTITTGAKVARACELSSQDPKIPAYDHGEVVETRGEVVERSGNPTVTMPLHSFFPALGPSNPQLTPPSFLHIPLKTENWEMSIVSLLNQWEEKFLGVPLFERLQRSLPWWEKTASSFVVSLIKGGG